MDCSTKKGESNEHLIGYNNGDFARDISDRKSTSRCIIV